MKNIFRFLTFVLTFVLISLFAFLWYLVVSLFSDSIPIGILVSVIVIAVQAIVSYALWGVLDD